MNPHGITHEPPDTLLVGDCAGLWRTFDSTRPDLAELARDTCTSCPVLDECRRQRDDWFAQNATLRIDAVGTWAGHTFGGRSATNRERLEAQHAAAGITKTRTPRQPATHCQRGHAFDEANTYVNPSSGKRQCKQCRMQSLRQARKAAA